MSWLPKVIDLTCFNSVSEKVGFLYQVFENDLKNKENPLFFDGREVKVHPNALSNKCLSFLETNTTCDNEYQCATCPYILYEDIFNHITTKQNKKLSADFRTPGIFSEERAIRINWIRPIIENVNSSSDVLYYQTITKSQLKHCFWLKKEKYLVILVENNKGDLYLNTAYYLYDRKMTSRIRLEYKKYCSKNVKKTPFTK